MKGPLLVLSLCLAVGVMAVQAQEKFVNADDEPESIWLKKGQSFYNDRNLAYVVNIKTANDLLGTIRRLDAINDALEEEKTIYAGLESSYEALSVKYAELNDIQNKAFADLLRKQADTEALVKRATDNTDAALAYAKKVRLVSYATCGLVGGVAGGLVDNSKSSFGLLGASIGTALGAVLAFGIQALTGR